MGLSEYEISGKICGVPTGLVISKGSTPTQIGLWRVKSFPWTKRTPTEAFLPGFGVLLPGKVLVC